MQIIYRCTATLRLWLSLSHVLHHGLFMEVSARFEDIARDIFSTRMAA
jgi:hypothetical protein